MKIETLERGKKIQEEIAELRKHLSEVFPAPSYDAHKRYDQYGFEYSKLDGKKDVTPKFRSKPFFSGSSNELRNEFVPFPIDKFMKIYKANVEEKIASLKEEFENLKD